MHQLLILVIEVLFNCSAVGDCGAAGGTYNCNHGDCGTHGDCTQEIILS